MPGGNGRNAKRVTGKTHNDGIGKQARPKSTGGSGGGSKSGKGASGFSGGGLFGPGPKSTSHGGTKKNRRK
jgi:hypothetical protein